MEERRAIVAGHTDDDAAVEGEDTGGREVGGFGMLHNRTKILESGSVAYCAEKNLTPNPFPKWKGDRIEESQRGKEDRIRGDPFCARKGGTD